MAGQNVFTIGCGQESNDLDILATRVYFIEFRKNHYNSKIEKLLIDMNLNNDIKKINKIIKML